MNLAEELHKAGFKWAVELADRNVREADPEREAVKIPSLKVTLRATDEGGREVKRSMDFHVDSVEKTNELLGYVLQDRWPNHPVNLKWRDHQGYQLVKMVPGFEEGAAHFIYQAATAATRRAALGQDVDGPQNTILLQAFLRLAPSDRSAVVERTVARIHDAHADANIEAGQGARLTRRHIGVALRHALVTDAAALLLSDSGNVRLPDQEFSLRCFVEACKGSPAAVGQRLGYNVVRAAAVGVGWLWSCSRRAARGFRRGARRALSTRPRKRFCGRASRRREPHR